MLYLNLHIIYGKTRIENIVFLKIRFCNYQQGYQNYRQHDINSRISYKEWFLAILYVHQFSVHVETPSWFFDSVLSITWASLSSCCNVTIFITTMWDHFCKGHICPCLHHHIKINVCANYHLYTLPIFCYPELYNYQINHQSSPYSGIFKLHPNNNSTKLKLINQGWINSINYLDRWLNLIIHYYIYMYIYKL